MISFKFWIFNVLVCSTFGFLEGNNIPKFYPQGYHLDLFPDVNTGLLKGSVCINIATYSEPSNVIELDADPSIVIHYKSIRINELHKDAQNDDANQTKHAYEVRAVERVLFGLGTLKIHLSQKLRRDITYKVHIGFETQLKNDSSSQPFFMRVFFDSNTRTERKFVIMDLTKNGCYKAFPCFNKLDYKCWVSLAVVRKPNYYALSTAPVINTTDVTNDGTLVKDYFLTTPPMSMNSLALIVSDYRIINTLYFSGVMHSLYLIDRAHEDENNKVNQDRTRAISPIVKLILKRVEDHVGIQFPLPSFHVVLVPESANIPYINAFGLLIVNISSATNIDEDELTEKLVLDICHQWFVHVATPVTGNSTIYAIMSHVKNIIAQELFTNAGTSSMNKFNYGQSMLMKMLESPASYAKTLETKSQSVFEILSFNMLDQVYPGLVSEAMYKFLRKKEFKMYSDTDIWDALNDIGRERNIYKSDSELNDLHRVALSWRNVGLLPLVSVKRKYGGASRNVTISQEPFIYPRFSLNNTSDKPKLPSFHAPLIPLMISPWQNFFESNHFLGWLSENSFEFEPLDDSVILMNRGHMAPFIVNYDDENWRKLAEVFDILPMDIQLQLLIDSLALSKAGILDYTVFLNMSAKIPIDTEHIDLWTYYSILATHAAGKFHGSTRVKYDEFVSRQVDFLLSKIVEEKLEKKSKSTQKMVTETKYRFSCLLNRSLCYTPDEYKNLMHEARAGKRLTGKHCCEIIKNVTLSDWEVIANGLFHALHNFPPRDRSHLLHVLSCTEHRVAFETYMNVLLLNFNKSNIVSENDQLYVIKHMDYNNLRLLLNFVDKNFNLLKERLGKETWETMMEEIIKSARSREDLGKLREFIHKNFNKFHREVDRAPDIVKNEMFTIQREISREAKIFPVLEKLMDVLVKEFSKKFLLSWDKFPLNAM